MLNRAQLSSVTLKKGRAVFDVSLMRYYILIHSKQCTKRGIVKVDKSVFFYLFFAASSLSSKKGSKELRILTSASN